MRFRATLGLPYLLFLCASLFWDARATAGIMEWIFAEQHEITSGEFRGFVIGSTKQVAAELLMKLGGRDLMAISLPPDLAEPTRDLLKIAALVTGGNGIQIGDLQGLDIRVFFEGDQVVAVENRRSASAGQLFNTGQDRQSVNSRLKMLLQQNPRIQVGSTARIDSAYWGAVNKDVGRALSVLSGYDGWHFIVPTEKPGGAIYRLFFRDDRLVRLEYERPRIAK
jgi:hypothetical protein